MATSGLTDYMEVDAVTSTTTSEHFLDAEADLVNTLFPSTAYEDIDPEPAAKRIKILETQVQDLSAQLEMYQRLFAETIPSNWSVRPAADTGQIIPHSVVNLDSEQHPDIWALLTDELRSNARTARMRLVSIRRNENIPLFQLYLAKVKQIQASMDPAQRAAAVGEVYAWHGTSEEAVELILRDGFDVRVAKDGALGAGIYFAEHAYLALTYAAKDKYQRGYFFIPAEADKDHRATVIYSRVYPGVAVDGPEKKPTERVTRPPINPQTGRPYDSINGKIGHCRTTCIFYDHQSYPEYVLTLKPVYTPPDPRALIAGLRGVQIELANRQPWLSIINMAQQVLQRILEKSTRQLIDSATGAIPIIVLHWYQSLLSGAIELVTSLPAVSRTNTIQVLLPIAMGTFSFWAHPLCINFGGTSKLTSSEALELWFVHELYRLRAHYDSGTPFMNAMDFAKACLAAGNIGENALMKFDRATVMSELYKHILVDKLVLEYPHWNFLPSSLLPDFTIPYGFETVAPHKDEVLVAEWEGTTPEIEAAKQLSLVQLTEAVWWNPQVALPQELQNEICCICRLRLDEAQDDAGPPAAIVRNETVYKMGRCHGNHGFHQFCLAQYRSMTRSYVECPICKELYGVRVGVQPAAKMFVQLDYLNPLPGFKTHASIVIRYVVPYGLQGRAFSNPAYRYDGTERTAYLPHTAKGIEILLMLKCAFERGLIFTVGQSVTSGKKNVTTWAGIHHKTARYATDKNPYGYPDKTYLERVKAELVQRGIPTAKNLSKLPKRLTKDMIDLKQYPATLDIHRV